MFKKKTDEDNQIANRNEAGEEKPRRATNRKFGLAIAGAGLGAFAALNYSTSTFAIITGAVLGGVGAYYFG